VKILSFWTLPIILILSKKFSCLLFERFGKNKQGSTMDNIQKNNICIMYHRHKLLAHIYEISGNFIKFIYKKKRYNNILPYYNIIIRTKETSNAGATRNNNKLTFLNNLLFSKKSSIDIRLADAFSQLR
jgi:hypothetical protein